MEKFETSGARSALRAVSMAQKWGKVAFGICLLCAMVFSAVAAQRAAASGQTAFTCVKTASTKTFKSEHCVPGETGTSFGHEAFSGETHAEFSNEKTNAETNAPTQTILKATIAETHIEFKATGVEGLGSLKNEEVAGEMRASFETDANGIIYNGVTVAAPAGKGCKIFEDKEGVKGTEGVFKTKPLKGHTTVVTEEGKEVHSVIIEPAEAGKPFATFFTECEKGKVPAELEGTWEVTGSLTCPTHGATIECNHNTVTETKALKVKGVNFGIEGKLTLTSKKLPFITEPPTTPISATTIQKVIGQEAFTCTEAASVKEFSTAHCVSGETGTKFGHVAVSEETHAKFSNEKTNAGTNGTSSTILKETIAATNLELEATGSIEGLGTLKNEEVGGEKRASAESGAEGITYKGVVVKAPTGKGCKVFEDKEATKEKGAEGVVRTRPVKGHTIVVKDKENGEGAEGERHSVIIEPKEAGSTLFATFFIECEKGKVPAELEGTWEISGTVTCPTHGATIVCNHNTVTETKALKGKGAKAGLAGKATITGKKLPFAEPPPTKPVSVTTVSGGPGQEAFTCVSTAAKLDFSSEHCVPGETGTKFGHVAISEETHAKVSNEKTNAGTNGPTNSIFKEVIAGTTLELESMGAIEGLGTLKNEEVGGEKRARVTSDESGIAYNGVVVNRPEGKGCKVFEDKEGVHGTEGVVKTKPLTGHTIVTGTTHEVVIEPVTPSLFATFFIECEKGKVPEELEGTWEVTGSLKCPTHGATISCEHEAVTTQNTLKGKGSKAGLQGKATITAGELPAEPPNPISVTTIQKVIGQEAFTCTERASVKEFATAHCVPGETGTKFGHVSITEEIPANISNEKTNATTTGPTNTILKETIAGTNLELESTGAIEGLGTLKNEEVGGEKRAKVTSDANGLTYHGVVVKAPAGKGCKVFEDKEGVHGTEGVVKTKPLTGHTIVTGTTHEVVIEPVTPSLFATFFIECEKGKVPEELEGTWEVTGSLKCPTHGATISCEHEAVTTQNTLKGKGIKAGIEGKVTISFGETPNESPNPVSFTTTP